MATSTSEAHSEHQLDELREELARVRSELHSRTKELQESLEHQTATANVLSVISSSPGQLEPVFHCILSNARRLCAAEYGHLLLFDGRLWRAASLQNLPEAYAEYWRTNAVEAGPDTSLGRMQRTGKPDHIADILEGPGYRKGTPLGLATAELGRARTLLCVPLLKDGRVIGGIAVYRMDVRPFDAKQIALLSSFADQAVISIENARLFEAEQTRTRELQEALDQQTATADVLKAISRSTFDLQKVLDVLVETAARLCEADGATMTRQIGSVFVRAAFFGLSDEFIAAARRERVQPGRSTVSNRVLQEGRVVQIPDVLQDPEYTWNEGRHLASFRTVLGVPLLREGVPIGVMSFTRSSVRPFTDKQIELLQTFADQAVIAIENARLFEAEQMRSKELQEALKRQTATSDVLNVISRSPTDATPVFDIIGESAERLCDAEISVVSVLDGDCIRVAGIRGISAKGVELFRSHFPMSLDRETITARTVRSGNINHVGDVLADATYDNKELALATGYRSCLAVPMFRQGEVVGSIFVARTKPSLFSDSQVQLLRTSADQAVIAIENARLFDEVQTRTRELQESLEHQTATSEVLSVISRSPSELQPVLNAIVSTAADLCEAEFSFIMRAIDGTGHLVAANNATTEFIRFVKANPVPFDRATITGRVGLDKTTVHVPDVLADPKFTHHEWQRVGKQRSVLGVPLLRDGNSLIGVMILARTKVAPFSDKQIRLVETFADQAVIAINNVELFEQVQMRTRELQESLEQQTTTADILRVISTANNDTTPVFKAIVEAGRRLVPGSECSIALLDGDTIRLAAFTEADQELAAIWKTRFPVPLSREYFHGAAILDCKVIDMPDVHLAEDRFSAGRSNHLPSRYRAITHVPLVSGGKAVGALAVPRLHPGALSEKQLALLMSFADQAVIAIENARLFEAEQTRKRDLARALEYQTAISDVLKVVSSSAGELAPVFDSILNDARRLCEARFGHLFLFDGTHFRAVALHHTPAAYSEYLSRAPIKANPETGLGRMASKRSVVHIADIKAEEAYKRGDPLRLATADLGGARTFLAVPMLKEDQLIGTIVVYRDEVRPFSEEQINLVTNFADQAVIAIENASLFEEVRQRTKELTRSVSELRALGEVGQAVSSSLDLKTVLGTILKHACEISHTGGAAIYVRDPGKDVLVLEAGHNMSDALIAAVREHPLRLGDPVVGECAARGEPVQLPDIETRPDHPLFDVLHRSGFRALLAVPLIHQSRTIGVLVVRRGTAGTFASETVALLQSFASQSSIAINNARLFREIEEKGEQLRLASQHKSQFLANMSHELRTPLNAILGYTELLIDGAFGPLTNDQKETLDRIERNGRHLLGLINDVLDLSKIEAGEMALAIEEYSLSSLVRTAVVATEPLARQKGLSLDALIADQLPLGRGDTRRLAQVLLNLIGNAIKFTDRGSVTILATCEGSMFRIDVRDTGPGIAASDIVRIFEKFQQVDNTSTRKKGGSGLGLAISREFIHMHGGTIEVCSVLGEGSVFTIIIPVEAQLHRETLH